ncbi:MAG: hypothetical protein AAFN94_03860 [Pseudomonadota bacterium]
MIRWIAVCLAFWPQGAVALSCLPWGVPNAYLAAEKADERYVPVLGKLSFSPRDLPVVDMSRQDEAPPLTKIRARFDGHALGRAGDWAISAEIVLEVACFGPWCSRPKQGEILGFLREDSGTYALATNPCGGFLFGSPDAGDVQQMRDCVAGRGCEPVGWN